MNPSRAAALAFGAALAGCVGVPIDELLASTTIVAELPIESGALVEVARFPAGPARDASPARVIVAFHGDVTRLDLGERFTLRLYKALTGEKMPYAIIMYSWSSDAPVGTTTPSIPTGKIQTIVVERGGVGEWREL